MATELLPPRDVYRPKNEHCPWKLHSRDISEKVKQSSARNDAKYSKCFQFLCNNSERTWFFSALTFPRPLGRCWKQRPWASVFNTSHGTWRMLMHEKPCLIPILFESFCLRIMSCIMGKEPWWHIQTAKFRWACASEQFHQYPCCLFTLVVD